MSEELWGVFFGDDSGRTYLVATTQSEEEALEHARGLDQESFERALVAYNEGDDEAPEPDWDDFSGMHFVEPISEELAAEAAGQLARGFAVWVE